MLSSVGIRLSFFLGHMSLPLNTNYTEQTTSGAPSDATQQQCFTMNLASLCTCFCESQQVAVMTLKQTHAMSSACLLPFGL